MSMIVAIPHPSFLISYRMTMITKCVHPWFLIPDI